MRLHMILLAFVAGPALAQDGKEERPAAEEVAPGRIWRGERGAPAVCVRLREGGALLVKAGEEWKDATLDDVSKLLKTFTEEQDEELQKKGKSAYETAPGSTVKVSALFLSIEAEPTIPWQHLAWLMSVAAEQKYWKLELSDGTRRFLCTLPVDRGIAIGLGAERPVEIKLSVHAAARREQPAKWGQILVNRPTEVVYKTGAEEHATVADVAKWVKKAWEAVKAGKDTKDTSVLGEIKAGNKVPVAAILDLVEMFETAGLSRLNFYGVRIPPREMRTVTGLPYPLKNYEE